MAEANVDFADRKLDDMKNKVIRVFDELGHFLAYRRKLLLDRLAKIRQDCHTNFEFFASHQLIEPHAICLSQNDELYVTDVVKQCVMKFSFAGDLIAQTGSKGNEVEQFTGIAGLFCEPGLVYICDSIVERIQIFDSDLNFIKEFGHGQLIHPTDVKIISENVYILSQNDNCIYCYNTYCVLEKKIELTGHEHMMTDAIFFEIDREGNFLITDLILEQILVFSAKGVLRIFLYTENLPHGIVIDNLFACVTVKNVS